MEKILQIVSDANTNTMFWIQYTLCREVFDSPSAFKVALYDRHYTVTLFPIVSPQHFDSPITTEFYPSILIHLMDIVNTFCQS